MVITLTENEHAALGNAQFVSVSFNLGSEKQWVTIRSGTGQPGDVSTRPAPSDASHKSRIELTGVRVPEHIPIFATEHVKAWSDGEGVVYGNKPTMSRPLMRQGPKMVGPGMKSISADHDVGIPALRDAVRIVNNCKREYGEQLELSIEDGILRARMMLEL